MISISWSDILDLELCTNLGFQYLSISDVWVVAQFESQVSITVPGLSIPGTGTTPAA